MSNTVLSLLKQAFHYGDECYMAFDGVIDQLANVLEALPEEDSEIRTLTDQMLQKTFAMQDTWHTQLEDLRDLSLKYRTAYLPTKISPEVDELVEVLAKIETRRQGLRPEQE